MSVCLCVCLSLCLSVCVSVQSYSPKLPGRFQQNCPHFVSQVPSFVRLSFEQKGRHGDVLVAIFSKDNDSTVMATVLLRFS